MASDDRSISIGGNAVGSVLVTGDHNTVHSKVTLPSAEDVDLRAELDAIRQLLAALDLSPKDRRKVDNALDEADDEAAEDEPDRASVGKAIERVFETVDQVGKLDKLATTLRPHLERVAAWLGTHAAPWLISLGV